MGFLDMLCRKPTNPKPNTLNSTPSDEVLPPEARWVQDPPPNCAWWLNDFVTEIATGRDPIIQLVADRRMMEALVQR